MKHGEDEPWAITEFSNKRGIKMEVDDEVPDYQQYIQLQLQETAQTQALTNAERQRRYRERKKARQMNPLPVITPSTTEQLNKLEQEKLARKRRLNQQRQRRFRLRRKLKAPNTSHQEKIERFPTNPSLRATWLGALQEDCKLEKDSAVCSEHFLMNDLLKTSNGKLLLRVGAVPVVEETIEEEHFTDPSDVKVCRVCLKTEGEMCKMEDNDTFSKVYQVITGVNLSEEVRLPRSVCPECCSWLLECERFKSTSLRSHLVLQQILNRYGCITVESVLSINKCYSPVNLDATDKQTDQCHSHNEAVIKHEDAQTVKNEKMVILPDVSKDITDIVKVESDDSNLMNLDIVKVEYDNDTDKVTDDNDNTENSVVDNVLDLQETAPEFVKVESEVMNDKSEHGAILADKDCSSDEDLPLTELTQTKKLQDYNHMNDDTRREQGIDGVSIDDKMSHDDSNDDDILLPCNICNVFIAKSFLQRHLQTHSVEEPKSNLINHLTIQSGEMPYTFTVGYQSGNISVDDEDSDEESHVCKVCNLMFSEKSELQKHLRTHSIEKPYTCSICSEGFARVDDLSKHINAHNVIYSTSSCDKTSQKPNSEKHSKEKPFTCNICLEDFDKLRYLRKHIKAHNVLYKCNHCEKAFAEKSNLDNHMMTHSEVTPYTCSICSEGFTRLGLLRKHINTHNKLHACNLCHKKFTHKCNLEKHVITHSGEKPYTCNICSRSFKKPANLSMHMKIHSDEKPHACHICTSTFSEKCNLKRHMTLTHPEEKP